MKMNVINTRDGVESVGMNHVIELAERFGKLWETAVFEDKVTLLWLESGGFKSLCLSLERDLMKLTGIPIEVVVCRSDQDDHLVYEMTTTSTIKDLCEAIAEHEQVRPEDISLIAMEAPVMWQGHHIEGRLIDISVDKPMSDYLNHPFIAVPSNITKGVWWDCSTKLQSYRLQGSTDTQGRGDIISLSSGRSDLEGIYLPPCVSVKDLKRNILIRHKIPISEQIIIMWSPGYGWKTLSDNEIVDFTSTSIPNFAYKLHSYGLQTQDGHFRGNVHVGVPGTSVVRDIKAFLQLQRGQLLRLWDRPPNTPGRRDISNVVDFVRDGLMRLHDEVYVEVIGLPATPER